MRSMREKIHETHLTKKQTEVFQEKTLTTNLTRTSEIENFPDKIPTKWIQMTTKTNGTPKVPRPNTTITKNRTRGDRIDRPGGIITSAAGGGIIRRVKSGMALRRIVPRNGGLIKIKIPGGADQGGIEMKTVEVYRVKNGMALNKNGPLSGKIKNKIRGDKIGLLGEEEMKVVKMGMRRRTSGKVPVKIVAIGVLKNKIHGDRIDPHGEIEMKVEMGAPISLEVMGLRRSGEVVVVIEILTRIEERLRGRVVGEMIVRRKMKGEVTVKGENTSRTGGMMVVLHGDKRLLIQKKEVKKDGKEKNASSQSHTDPILVVRRVRKRWRTPQRTLIYSHTQRSQEKPKKY
uniref:Uncharacterized protein n=1 Tax=Photinus pyralis TaxID=7054 RepID=A0A1Y1K1F2_PHOPY